MARSRQYWTDSVAVLAIHDEVIAITHNASHVAHLLTLYMYVTPPMLTTKFTPANFQCTSTQN